VATDEAVLNKERKKIPPKKYIKKYQKLKIKSSGLTRANGKATPQTKVKHSIHNTEERTKEKSVM
jgi:hypothetical protein